MNKLQRGGTGGSPLDDDSALMLMARHVLGGPRDEGRASFQIALSVCPGCGRGRQLANGELVPVGAEVVAMAECDGQHLGPMAAPVASANPVASESTHVGENPVASANPVASESAHVGENRVTSAHAGARAKQTVTPATRRAVLCRDHRLSVVPGCNNDRFLDLHHVELRAEGGGNESDNLITLCGVHHRAAHRGELVVTGSVPAGVRFRHADGTDYGQPIEPRVADIQAKAFAALRGLGFREAEVRRALADSSEQGARDANLEGIVRDALARLTTTGKVLGAGRATRHP